MQSNPGTLPFLGHMARLLDLARYDSATSPESDLLHVSACESRPTQPFPGQVAGTCGLQLHGHGSRVILLAHPSIRRIIQSLAAGVRHTRSHTFMSPRQSQLRSVRLSVHILRIHAAVPGPSPSAHDCPQTVFAEVSNARCNHLAGQLFSRKNRHPSDWRKWKEREHLCANANPPIGWKLRS